MLPPAMLISALSASSALQEKPIRLHTNILSLTWSHLEASWLSEEENKLSFDFLGRRVILWYALRCVNKSWRIPICHVEGKKMCLLCKGQFHSFLFFWKSELHSSIIFPAAWVLGSRLHHPWWKRCLRNTRAALKQVRIRNSGHILARRAAAGLKASRCALYPLLALHSFTSDNNARGFCECIIVGHCTHNWTRLPV